MSFSGSASEADPPQLGTFYKTGFTYDAWVFKQSSKSDVAVVGSWSSSLGGPMIWVDHVTGHYRLTLGAQFADYLDSGRHPPSAAGSTSRRPMTDRPRAIFIDGVRPRARAFTANVGDSNSGGSAHTEPPRPASSTDWSTTSGSTTAR